jgi:hypothetical protein
MQAPAAEYEKDPDAVLDYVIDWETWLSDDVIDTSAWTADTGITMDSDSATTTTTTVWLSGGTAGYNYKVENRITTVGGRTDDRTLLIRVREQ